MTLLIMKDRILRIKCNRIIIFGVLYFLILLNAEIGYSHPANPIVKNDTALFLGNKALPPMIYMKDNKPVGIIVDIAEALKKRMSIPASFRYMNWSQAQKLILKRKADALLQINPSEERKKIYDFSCPPSGIKILHIRIV